MDTLSSDLPLINAIEARILGSLIEKKELTPDVYPLTLNAALGAANQKTAREPVMSLEQHDIHRALKSLQDKGLVRQVFGSRVERYEHQLGQRFSLTRGQTSLVGLMILRGPQTAYELLSRSERMARYASVEELLGDLDLLIGRKSPLVQLVPRGPGQREDRYAHLLGGPVETPARAPASAPRISSASPDLEHRFVALEEELAELKRRVERLENGG